MSMERSNELIKKGNAVISKFLGYSFVPDFNLEWSELIPAVKKIQSHGCIVEIMFVLGTICRIQKPSQTPALISCTENNSSIVAVWDAVLEYITWESLQPQMNNKTFWNNKS